MYKSFFTMMGMRFLRGFVAGAVGSISMLGAGATNLNFLEVLQNPKAWVFAVLSGGITGACLAVDKWIRSDGSDYNS